MTLLPALTIADVCRLLQIKRRTFYGLDKAGKLPVRELDRVGHIRRFRADDMERYLTGGETPNEIEAGRYFARVRRAKLARLERKAG